MEENNLRSLVDHVESFIKEIYEKYNNQYCCSVPGYMRHILESREVGRPDEEYDIVLSSVIDTEVFNLNVCDYIDSYFTGESVEDRIWVNFSQLMLEVLSGQLCLSQGQINQIVIDQFRLKSAGKLPIPLIQEVMWYRCIMESRYNKIGYFASMEPQQPASILEKIHRYEEYLVETVSWYFKDERQVAIDREKWNVMPAPRKDLVDLLSRCMVSYLNKVGVCSSVKLSDEGIACVTGEDGRGEFEVVVSEEPTRILVRLVNYKGKQLKVSVTKDSTKEYKKIAKGIMSDILLLRSLDDERKSTIDVANKLLGDK